MGHGTRFADLVPKHDVESRGCAVPRSERNDLIPAKFAAILLLFLLLLLLSRRDCFTSLAFQLFNGSELGQNLG